MDATIAAAALILPQRGPPPLRRFSAVSEEEAKEEASVTGSEKGPARYDEMLRAAVGTARKLLELDAFAARCDHDEAVATLKKLEKGSFRHAEALNASWDLAERLLLREQRREPTTRRRKVGPNTVGKLFNRWVQAQRGIAVLQPAELFEKLLRISRLFSSSTTTTTNDNFALDVTHVHKVLAAVPRRVPPTEAPLQAERILEMLLQNGEPEPDVFAYNQVLRCWSVSGSENAVLRMEELMQQMKDRGIPPDTASYSFLLRATVRRRSGGAAAAAAAVRGVLRRMEGEGVEPDAASLLRAAQSHCGAGKPAAAERYLRRMLDLHNPDRGREAALVGIALNEVLLAYRDVVASTASGKREKQGALQRAEKLFDTVAGNAAYDTDKTHTAYRTMMNLYGHARMPKKAAAILEQQRRKFEKGDLSFEPTEGDYGILINAYRVSGEPDMATEVLFDMLDNTPCRADQRTIHTVVDAWASSLDPDALDRAFEVVSIMGTHPKCKHLQPNLYIFNGLLKCVALSGRKDAWQKAEKILEAMDLLSLEGNTEVKPDAFSYTLAVKACINGGNMDRIESFLTRMEAAGVSPDTRTFNEILRGWAQRNSSEAAEKTEQILADMQERSSTKPDTVSYTTALTAWSRSKDPVSAARMWKLSEQMQKENIPANIQTYTLLIQFLSKTGKQQDLEKAESLLQSMDREQLRPDNRHFLPLVEGWMEFGETKRADRVLRQWIDAFSDGTVEFAPSAALCHTVMQGWLSTGNPGKAKEILESFQVLHQT
jgi:pentatricopeptide repeat protein